MSPAAGPRQAYRERDDTLRGCCAVEVRPERTFADERTKERTSERANRRTKTKMRSRLACVRRTRVRLHARMCIYMRACERVFRLRRRTLAGGRRPLRMRYEKMR